MFVLGIKQKTKPFVLRHKMHMVTTIEFGAPGCIVVIIVMISICYP
jgi:hypothetical protein